MSRRVLSVLALCGVLGALMLAFALRARSAPAAVKGARIVAQPVPLPAIEPAPQKPDPPSRFDLLPPLRIENQTTHELLEVKLYDTAGNVDESAALRLDTLLCDARDPKHRQTTRINRRTLQLLFKAAYHFALYEVEVVSAYRKSGRHREGFHGTGSAIDFRLRGLSAPQLAAYLRDLPRTGVGVYTHPKTQYVHLDSRDMSFHWLDASPPRRRWREKSIGAADLAARDRRYTSDSDLPFALPTAAAGTTSAAR
jgi:uncharacterized protein YcbK (DUF882 family)